ncbi:MarR family winged helix-turn-helix transcriptional regulator [Streptomyces physcomitrii]|uniref:Winged helix-turn-helix transcriptional regulator n=1 Tax=Streptomyces physcomitrii TaxID=2724184 RepID=A0ABX1GVN7_9ACTN|nr:MarR family winged helix-turn-helix transcriptional regulator [Streptomyces physcomitrii]NKI40152.1 winged helix-turn-helix transcriptional regulator [Streptomyces physcomitrii]
MRFSHSDTELVQQPIGYWSWAAHKAVVTHIRTGLAAHGLSQPQWWILAQVARSEAPLTGAEVVAVLEGYLDVGSSPLIADLRTLRTRGLLTTTPPEAEPDEALLAAPLALTEAGAETFAACAALQTRMRAEIHEGIGDEEYLRTLKVLQRMIHNTGGQAWHH